MLAALTLTPNDSAARVKLRCSDTATKTRRLPSGSLRKLEFPFFAERRWGRRGLSLMG
jgi:hypothetical protein